MRKLLLSFATLLVMGGLVVAAEVAIVKYDKDKKELTVKDGDKETTYKLTDKTRLTIGEKEGRLDVLGKVKLADVVTDKDEVIVIKVKGRKK